MTADIRHLRCDARRNRDKILTIARRQFLDSGTLGTMTEMAQTAELGIGTAYRHFPCAKAVQETLVREQITALLLRVKDRTASLPDPSQALAAILHDVLDLDGHPGTATVLAAKADTQAETTRAKGYLDQAIAHPLTSAQQAGHIRTDITAADLRLILSGIRISYPSDHDVDRAHLYLTVLLAGLRPPG